MFRFITSLALVSVCAVPASTQSLFATSVVNFQQGSGGGIFDTSNILGGPQGLGLMNGSLDVLTLGEAGSIVLGFDVTIADGPGADLAVFENGFAFGDAVFAELAWVEVSTDGVVFARFPNRYGPPVGGPSSAMGSFAGVGGGLPVIANVSTDPESPFDPANAGGEALDLADLANHPDVISGAVDLDDIHFVRLVDLPPGALDDDGVIYDSGATGGSDFDAVAVLNHAAGPATPPVCDLTITDTGVLELRLGDPDGFSDLTPASIQVTANLAPVPFDLLLSVFTVDSFDGNVAVLRSVGPVMGQGVTVALGMSVRDDGGTLRGDQVMLQGT